MKFLKSITAAKVFAVLFVGTLFLFSGVVAEAATLGASPSTGVYTTGATFDVRVTINTQGKSINAAEGVLKFNPRELQVVSVSQAGSIFNLWTIDPAFSNSAGTVSFGGGSPKGYTGTSGTIITVRFRASGSGASSVSFSSGSVLAADGMGTNVLSGMSGGNYTISATTNTPEPEKIIEYVAPVNTPSAPTIRSTTHPEQAAWYPLTTAELSWNVPADVVAVRTSLTDSPSSVPTVVYDSPISSRTVQDLSDGVQYFHVQFKNENGWGKVAHYRLAVDTQKPTAFDISIASGTNPYDPQPTLHFAVDDAGSPIKDFVIQIDGGDTIQFTDETGSSTYQLPRLGPGRHTVVVEALDAAGNSIVSTFVLDITAFERPIFTDVPSQIGSDVIPVILGSTRPEAVVTITLVPVGGTPEVAIKDTYEVVADTSGVFTFIPDGKLAEGVYELTAIAVDPFGAQSESSEPARLVVQQPGYMAIGSMLVDVLSLIVTFAVLLGVLLLGVLYFWRRVRVVGQYVRKETQEAEEVTKEAFTGLTATLESAARTLAATRKSQQLTKAEAELVETMRSEILAASTRVSREVSEVDDIV